MNGTHRPEGILVASARLEATERNPAIVDVAPSLLAAMGVPWEECLDGAVLLEPRPYDREQERRVSDRLRALGYLE